MFIVIYEKREVTGLKTPQRPPFQLKLMALAVSFALEPLPGLLPLPVEQGAVDRAFQNSFQAD